jgi:8-oxo-dGTP pyrophosphatase MutT (NUDIX family)
MRLAQLRKLRDCEQVAAVCYRVRPEGIEFLLVRTRGSGRWTFPKGSAEPGLTHAQAAALEAFEEAGVHGRIEEVSFARYIRRKRGGDARKSGSRASEKALAVSAHLCEVSRLSPPRESNRDRTWFSADDARRRLREGRATGDGAEFARVIDRAVERIRHLRSASGPGPRLRERSLRLSPNDPLRKVQFEAFADAPSARRAALTRLSQAMASRPRLCEVLEFAPERGKRPKALGTGVKTG